jgi:lysophospholipase L1-like esterase
MLVIVFMLQAVLAQNIPTGVRTNPCAVTIPYEQHTRFDFGEFCKYEAANAALPPAGPRRVVYFGDSLTEGWLRNIVGLDASDTHNRGIGGQTTAQMLVRFRADVLNLRPRIVHLMVGTNDIAGNKGPTSLTRIQEAVMSMCEQARSHGIRVILASVLPAKIIPWNRSVDPVPAVRALNQWLVAYAGQNGHTYADYYSVLHDGQDGFQRHLAIDGIHPNAEGYEVMRPVAMDAIRRANLQ